MPKIYLIDGMSLVFRAYHAMQRTNLKTPRGEPSSAIFGFTNIITSFIEKEKPEYLAVLFDRSEPTFRHEIYPAYKANRDAFPEELAPQLEKIKELLDHLAIPRIEIPTFEADDIAGTIANIASSSNFETYCLTSDKDFYQLVSENVKLIKPSGKNGDFEIIDLEKVKEKFGGSPEQVIDVLALIGDASDNIPGVKGVGEKTAIPLIQKFGSLENLYQNLDQIENTKLKEKLIEGKESAFLSKELIKIKTDLQLDFKIENLKWERPNFESLDNFFKNLGFNSIREKWKNKAIEYGIELKNEDNSKTSELKCYDKFNKNYQLIDSYDKLDKLIKELSEVKYFAIDTETSSLDKMQCSIVGISFSYTPDSAYYIPLDESKDYEYKENSSIHELNLFTLNSSVNKPFESSLPARQVLNKLKPILEEQTIAKYGQNCKFDSFILKRYGINLSPIKFDTMIASYLLNPDEQHNLEALAQKWLGYKPIAIETIIGDKKSKQKSMKDKDPHDIYIYACEDADLALQLTLVLKEKLENESLINLAEKIEFPLIEVLTRMEFHGVAIDIDALRKTSSIIDNEIRKLTIEIYKEAGIEFNIDSPKQLAHILFEKLMIPPIKSGKTGFSTDIQVLNQLAETYPIAQKVLEYRQLVKLKTTYVDVLPSLVNKQTGRIHTTFNQTITATGRLSSTDPNLQNIPIRSDLGKEVRKAFVPQNPDWYLFSADYSQIELRIMAYISGDEQLIKAFSKGIDIHADTASKLFNIPLEKVNQDMRRVAKTVNFGIMYGLGSFGLSQRIGLSKTEAQKIIDNYFKNYPGIKKYIEKVIKSTQEKGYAETLLGRKRYFPNINSKNKNLRQADERAAINMPIQGTASDMMKSAMIEIDKKIRDNKLNAMMILQIHDELLFEVPENEIKILSEIVVEKMQNALNLGEVPVIVDTGFGKNWFEAH